MQMTVAIVIPTMNRPDFLIRLLEYYADTGCNHSIYVGDSSDDSRAEPSEKAIKRLRNRLNISYQRCPGLNDMQTMSHLLNTAQEPFAAFIADDDFLVPTALEACAQYLEDHPKYSAAHGLAGLCDLQSSGPYGEVRSVGQYRQRALTGDTATNRLTDYLSNYFVTLFSVHRTEHFREEIAAAALMPDIAFRELLPCCLSVVRGNVAQLPCFYMVRQDHDQRYSLPDIFDWITHHDWLPSYEIFSDHLAQELVRQDQVSLNEANQVVKQAFWSYLVNVLSKKRNGPYAPHKNGLRSRSRSLARTIPLVAWGWKDLRSRLPGEENKLSLPALLRPSSPFHANFKPIYRSMTRSLSENAQGNSNAKEYSS